MKHYRLVDHTNKYGHYGLVIDRDRYIAIPYYDRALFELVHPDGDGLEYHLTLIDTQSTRTEKFYMDEYSQVISLVRRLQQRTGLVHAPFEMTGAETVVKLHNYTLTIKQSL